jgi:hypothetical protein
MATTFDATLKGMGRDSPLGFLTAFDQPPHLPVKLLNVDLSVRHEAWKWNERKDAQSVVPPPVQAGDESLARSGWRMQTIREIAGPER